METTVRSNYDAYQNIHQLCVKEGQRQMKVLASMDNGKIEFCYYLVRKWDYPFDGDELMDEDRARLVDRIIQHYAAEGWELVIDRRRFCPKCHERLTGSDCSDWPGGVCGFCEREVDAFGDIPVPTLAGEPAKSHSGRAGWLKNSLCRFGKRSKQPPPPDFSNHPSFANQDIKEFIYSDSQQERVIITSAGLGSFRIYFQWWDTSEWATAHRAFWHGPAMSGYSATLRGAHRIAGAALHPVIR
jgi:hypothetical protein